MTNRRQVYIIAEAGVNHNGSIKNALRLVDIASDAGADAVKFKTFNADKLVTRDAPLAAYQRATTIGKNTQFEMLRKLELSAEDHFNLLGYCNKKGIQFLSTPFDAESAEFLYGKLDLPSVKVSSGDLTNLPFLWKVALYCKPLILSTGMSTLADVEVALGAIAYGLLGGQSPSISNFQTAYASDEGQRLLREKVTLLHCTTEYPAPLEEVNLEVMNTLSRAFGLMVGYSDHTQGIEIPIAAAALGATIIEKHFTLDKTLPGPDHKASLDPQELQNMVKGIRCVELAMGKPSKVVTESEQTNRRVARKSIVAARRIEAGELLTEDNITIKRPGNGLQPGQYWSVLGRRAAREFDVDELIEI